MLTNSILSQIQSVGGRIDPAQLIPQVYEDFKGELLSMLESLDSGEDYDSPFFSKPVDPYSQAFPIVQQETWSRYEQILTHLYKSMEFESKVYDMLVKQV